MTVYVTQEQRDFFTENGYLVVKQVYRQEQLTRLCEEYAVIWLQLLASGQVKQQAHDPFASLYPNRLRDFHQDNEGIRDFMMEPSAIGVLKELIGEEPIAVQSGFYYKPPGTRGLGYHQDNYHIGVSPDTSYAIWVSIDGADPENGSLLFVPGTHRLELASAEVVAGSTNAYSSEILRVPEGYKAIQIETEPGDIVIFTGNTYHGSTKNKSRYRYRRSFVTHFAPQSTDKVTLNYSHLVDTRGSRVRRRLNTRSKIMETQPSVFHYHDTPYYDQFIHKKQQPHSQPDKG